MEFTVLGPVAVSGAVELTGTRQRRLLAALLIQANTVVPADRLIDVLWGEHAPATASHNLHNLVWRLRSVLDTAAARAPAPLLTQPPGYLLRVDPQAIDATRFERMVAEAMSDVGRRPDWAAARLEEALALWRGPAFAEFAGDEFCRYEALRLEELRLVAIEEWFGVRLALGQHTELIGEIEAFAAEHPLRERARELLMLSLYRSGRQADALAVYRTFRDELADQLGLEPSPALRQRHQDILCGDLDRVEAPARSVAGHGFRVDNGEVRAELNDLVGRADEVAAALATLTAHRVVTMTGVGGVGKTRLALRVAADARERFPHGVWVCELAAVRDGWLVPDVLATTLGMQEPRGLSVTGGLVEFLKTRRALLVLDNCEHVLDDAARLVDVLARGCRDISILATSREPLGVDGEHVLPVQPLATDASVALFADRAAAATPTFTLGDDNIETVSEICRRLDGLPLAIELAATRVRSMAVDDIAGLLEDRLRFLRSTHRMRAERHSTLGTVVDWSYQLLDAAERAVFDRLSVLVGAFTRAAAAAIAGTAGLDTVEVGDAVTGLVHKSMLVADTASAPTRYTMLETLRLYGRERLESGGQTEQARHRHAAYHVELAEASAAGLAGPDEARWAERIAMSLDDLRGAHHWALANEPGTALRMSAALARYTAAHGPSEVYIWAERAVGACSGAARPDPHLSAVLAVAAAGAARRGDLTGAADLARRGLRAAGERDDPRRRHPLWVLARVASYAGRFREAADLYATVARLGRSVGDAHCVAYVTASGALQHAYSGATDEAARLAGEAARLAKATGNPTAIAWADYALGVALQDRDPEPALAALQRARAVARAGRNTYIPGVALSVAVSLLTRHGDLRVASRLAAEVIDYWSHESHWAQQWTVMHHVIRLFTRLGEPTAAATLHGALCASRTAVQAVGVAADLLDAHVTELTRRLGADRFAAAATIGAAMSDDDAVAFARATLERLGGV
jgi:predicted ATPase/DNA-binding SARP family transcriptional activator